MRSRTRDSNSERHFTDTVGDFNQPEYPGWQPMVNPNARLGEGNVGHQMMRRMGWEGAGLGSAEQGMQEPIKGGDVRDKMDKYKVCVCVCVCACMHARVFQNNND